MFKSIITYKYKKESQISIHSLEEQLNLFGLKDLLSNEKETEGFVKPSDQIDNILIEIDNLIYFKYAKKRKIIPNSIIHENMNSKIEEYINKNNIKPSKTILKTIKEETINDLLKIALTSTTYNKIAIDKLNKIIMIEASNINQAEDILSLLIKVLPALDIYPWLGIKSFSSLMNECILNDRSNDTNFDLGDNCELITLNDKKSSIKYKNFNLFDDEIKNNVKEGMILKSLSMMYTDKISFTLCNKGEIKQIKFLNLMDDDLENTEESNIYTDISLYIGIILNLLKSLDQLINEEN